MYWVVGIVIFIVLVVIGIIAAINAYFKMHEELDEIIYDFPEDLLKISKRNRAMMSPDELADSYIHEDI